MTSPTRGRGAVREWTKTCSDYDAQGNATEVLYQTVYQGKVYEIRATPDEVVFFQSPRRQVRAPAVTIMESIGVGDTIEDALDQHILHVAKPEAIMRFGSLTSRIEQRGAGSQGPAGVSEPSASSASSGASPPFGDVKPFDSGGGGNDRHSS